MPSTAQKISHTARRANEHENDSEKLEWVQDIDIFNISAWTEPREDRLAEALRKLQGLDVIEEFSTDDAIEQSHNPAINKFARLANEWRKETKHLSSIVQKSMHPAYQQIIGMGESVIPILLQHLKQLPDHWFWALASITGDNPVKPHQRGKMKEMANAWLTWGRKRGYC